MDKRYWDLFWTTGLPQAWLMCRDGEQRTQTFSGQDAEIGQGLSSPLANYRPRMTGNMPGDPRGII